MSTAPAFGDAPLVERCLAGEPSAWAELVERYGRYVYAIASQAFRLPEPDAEDVFQETFARVYEHLGRLKDASALRPWIGQVARRLCLDRLRAGSRETPAGGLGPAGIDDTISRLNDALAVHQAMDGLPERCREVLDRFFRRDESYAQIAAALAIPPGTVASRISRCVARLCDLIGAASGPGPGS